MGSSFVSVNGDLRFLFFRGESGSTLGAKGERASVACLSQTGSRFAVSVLSLLMHNWTKRMYEVRLVESPSRFSLALFLVVAFRNVQVSKFTCDLEYVGGAWGFDSLVARV